MGIDRLALFVVMSSGCAGASAGPAPAPVVANSTDASTQQRLDALERRVDALERVRSGESAAASWSCMAKCGTRSTATTDFRVDFERVTGQGTTAAAAYEDMVRKCDGRLYERIEDESFVGGDMKATCLRDAAPAGE